MKLKALAAAFAALGSAGVFAACPSNATVNGACAIQAPAATYYIAGASAQSQALNAIAKSLFDVSDDVIQIKSTTVDANDIQKHVGYYGIRNGQATLIVYRNSGGSGAGARQLVSKTTTAYTALPGAGTENNAMTLGTCTTATGGANTFTATCSSNTTRVADVALLDVNPDEHAPGVVPAAGADYVATADLLTTKTGLQGFGVIVNPALYAALQAQNAREGVPLGLGGQPSIRRADYASLVSVEGAIKNANRLLNTTGDSNFITVCRRTDTSGTQASSNMFFLNNVSGTVGFGGALTPRTAAGTGVGYTLNSSTGNVKTCMNTAGGYRIGVVSMENVPGGSDTWKFVRVDGVSPDVAFDTKPGVLTNVVDTKQRQNVARGDYPFAFESFVAVRSDAATEVQDLYTAIGGLIADSTLSDLVGFAYLDGATPWKPYNSADATPNQQSRVTRGGNNSQPLSQQ